MRLIDADHLIQIVCGSTILPDGFKDVFRKLVAGEPTVDRPTRSQFKRMAVQLGYEAVIHCGDCKHSSLPSMQVQLYGKPGVRTCHNKKAPCNRRNVFLDDFCSYGERKNDFVDDNKIGERKNDV